MAVIVLYSLEKNNWPTITKRCIFTQAFESKYSRRFFQHSVNTFHTLAIINLIIHCICKRQQLSQNVFQNEVLIK